MFCARDKRFSASDEHFSAENERIENIHSNFSPTQLRIHVSATFKQNFS